MFKDDKAQQALLRGKEMDAMIRNKYQPEKPNYSYKDLIVMALQSNQGQGMRTSQICNYIATNFSYYGNLDKRQKSGIKGWERSISQNLSKNRNIFHRVLDGVWK